MGEEIEERPDAARDAYWRELGRFLSYYSSVERQLNFLVRHYYRIGHVLANAILGPLRHDNTIDHINRLYRANYIDETDWAEILSFKEQLGQITRLRNDIVHYNVSYSVPDGFIVSTKIWAHVEDKVRTHLVSEKILDNAVVDLFKIFFKIQHILRPNDRKLNDKEWGSLLGEPWRYKPFSLASSDQTPPSPLPKTK